MPIEKPAWKVLSKPICGVSTSVRTLASAVDFERRRAP